MQMFQVYITDLVMNSTVMMETTSMMNLVICVGLPRVIHLMIPVEIWCSIGYNGYNGQGRY